MDDGKRTLAICSGSCWVGCWAACRDGAVGGRVVAVQNPPDWKVCVCAGRAEPHGGGDSGLGQEPCCGFVWRWRPPNATNQYRDATASAASLHRGKITLLRFIYQRWRLFDCGEREGRHPRGIRTLAFWHRVPTLSAIVPAPARSHPSPSHSHLRVPRTLRGNVLDTGLDVP